MSRIIVVILFAVALSPSGYAFPAREALGPGAIETSAAGQPATPTSAPGSQSRDDGAGSDTLADQRSTETRRPHIGTPPAAAGETGGTLFRALFGDWLERRGVYVENAMQVGVSTNNTSDTLARVTGGANQPVVFPGDRGFQLNALEVYLHKDILTNVIPRVGPIPGPVPQRVSWGFYSEICYGRASQPARMYGWDMLWKINEPGASNSALAAANRQNFLATPSMFAQVYVPLLNGMAITAGRFPTAIGFEIPPPIRPSNNFFYSRTTLFATQPQQVFGVLASVNVMRNAGAGYLSAEFGVNKGWFLYESNNGEPHYQFGLHYRSPKMTTGIDYEGMLGNSQTDPGPRQTGWLPMHRVVSPHGQRRMHHSLNGFHDFNDRWRVTAETAFGRQYGDGKPETILLGSIPGAGPGFSGASWGGVNGQILYRARRDVSYGLRLEHFRNPDGFALFPMSAVKSHFNAVTTGARYDVSRFVVLRPELRYDWQSANEGQHAFGLMNRNGKTYSSQLTASLDMILYF